jgi:hypothetical protein
LLHVVLLRRLEPGDVAGDRAHEPERERDERHEEEEQEEGEEPELADPAPLGLLTLAKQHEAPESTQTGSLAKTGSVVG